MNTCGTCLIQPPPLDACVAALDYAFPWVRLIAELKFQQGLHWVPLLSSLLERALPAQLSWPAQACLVPVPLSPERLCERGFNQALELARPLAQRRQYALAPELLRRTLATEQQARLDKEARQRNMHGAFHCPMPLAGRHCVLLDDVMTTGATLHEAARSLRRAGAASVSALVLARTPAP
ncbi:ComF family protein [Roseateles sp. BYS180W]|uniref:ComF family protein n=1 Tax=Roseateles rivi TaxID=3299028 RepID=A0ABW7FRH5_9BURK